MCKNELFQSSGTKNEFHAKFRDEDNSLTFIFWVKSIAFIRGERRGG
jgi:hypothetical protein